MHAGWKNLSLLAKLFVIIFLAMLIITALHTSDLGLNHKMGFMKDLNTFNFWWNFVEFSLLGWEEHLGHFLEAFFALSRMDLTTIELLYSTNIFPEVKV